MDSMNTLLDSYNLSNLINDDLEYMKRLIKMEEINHSGIEMNDKRRLKYTHVFMIHV